MFDINVRLNKDMETVKAKMVAAFDCVSFEDLANDIKHGFEEDPFNYEQFSTVSKFLYELDDNECRVLWNWLDLPNTVPVAA